MKKSFNQIFFIRKSKSNCSNSATIYLRITVDGVRTEISTQRNCEADKWNSTLSRVNGKTEEVKSVNSYLEALQFRIYEIHKNFTANAQILWRSYHPTRRKNIYHAIQKLRSNDSGANCLSSTQY